MSHLPSIPVLRHKLDNALIAGDAKEAARLRLALAERWEQVAELCTSPSLRADYVDRARMYRSLAAGVSPATVPEGGQS